MWIDYPGVNVYIIRLVMKANDILSNPAYHKKLVSFINASDDILDHEFYLSWIKVYGFEVELNSIWRPFSSFRFKCTPNRILVNRIKFRSNQEQDVKLLLEHYYLMAQEHISKNNPPTSYPTFTISRICKSFGEIGVSIV